MKENESAKEYLANDSEYYDGYKWSVFLGEKLIKTSEKIFNDVDEAADDCDIFLKEINWKEKAEKWNDYNGIENALCGISSSVVDEKYFCIPKNNTSFFTRILDIRNFSLTICCNAH